METTVVALDVTTGMRVADPERRYGENWRASNDLLVFEGTANDLIGIAEAMERRARTPGYQSNTMLRMARELRDAADTLAPDTLAPDTLAPDTLAPDTLAPDTLAAD